MTDETMAAPHVGAAEALDLVDDIALYMRLAALLGAPPTCYLLQHMGRQAVELFARRAVDADAWRAFRRRVTAGHPGVPSWTSPVAADGRRLASVPERLVYEAIMAAAPGVTIDVETAIHPAGGKWRADFRIRGAVGCDVLVEVAGLLASDLQPRTLAEADYAARLDAKLAAYAAARLPRPIIVYVDELCDPGRRRARVSSILAALEGERA